MKHKFRAPVTWFGQHVEWIGAGVLVVLAAFFRFWHLGTLPPGLTTAEARVGLEAWNMASHGWLPALASGNGLSPLWIWLEAGAVKLLGPTELALRLWPALLGVAAVVATRIWARDWFSRRVGWVAAFVVAIAPWAVTMSRNALPVVLMQVLVPLTLWIAGWAYHRRNVRWSLLLTGVLALDVLAGPLGWLLAVAVLILGLIRLVQAGEILKLDQARLVGLAGLVGIAAIGLFFMLISLSSVRAALAAAGIVHTFGEVAGGFGRVLLMFNLRGDENPAHNFGTEPLLNAFIGLMFVAGILAALSRLAQRRYRVTLFLLVIFLLPAWLSTAGVPNASHAAAVLPIAALLAGIGVSYMLELWYATFPINSAARSVGQAVIIVLLVLSVFQGYAQYFRAWSGSADTYTTYNEPAVAAAQFASAHKSPGSRYFVASPAEQPVVTYLNGKASSSILGAAQLESLPLGAGPQQFIITASARDAAAKSLRLKYPGGTLKPHTSAFSQNEIFYTYEVTR